MIKTQDIVFEDINNIISRILPALRLLEGKKILITGAAGLIPSYFLDTIYILNQKYFRKKCQVTGYIHKAIDKKNRLSYLKNDKNFNFEVVDVAKDFKIKSGFDYIIHAASKASPKEYLADPIGTIDANVKGTETILKYMLKNKVKSFMYFSSGEIYGDPPDKSVPTKEDYIPRTNHLSERSCYVEAKRFSETLCANYFRQYNLPVKIVRPIHVYGPGIKLNDGRVWAAFIKNAFEKKDIIVSGRGKATRGFAYMSDAIAQLWSVLLKGKNGEIYNIGNQKEISIKKLAEIIAEVFGNQIKIIIKNETPDFTRSSPKRSCPDMRKTLGEFNLKNEVSINAGLKRTIQWVKKF